MIFWILLLVQGHAFCMWHWPVRKHLDMSFIRRSSPSAFSRQVVFKLVALLFPSTRCYQDPTKSKQLSTFAILGFQFGLYHHDQVIIGLASLLYFHFWLIRCFTDPTYTSSIFVYGSLKHLYSWGRDVGDGGGSVVNGVGDDGCGIGSVVSDVIDGWEVWWWRWWYCQVVVVLLEMPWVGEKER